MNNRKHIMAQHNCDAPIEIPDKTLLLTTLIISVISIIIIAMRMYIFAGKHIPMVSDVVEFAISSLI